MNNRREGLLGEDSAMKYLLNKGYKLLERNYNGNRGEIDLIMLDSDTIVFVEVKARTSTAFGRPEDAVTPEKQRASISTAMEYIKKHGYYDYNVRFDVIAILRDKITHHINAFDLNSANYPMKYKF